LGGGALVGLADAAAALGGALQGGVEPPGVLESLAPAAHRVGIETELLEGKFGDLRIWAALPGIAAVLGLVPPEHEPALLAELDLHRLVELGGVLGARVVFDRDRVAEGGLEALARLVGVGQPRLGKALGGPMRAWTRRRFICRSSTDATSLGGWAGGRGARMPPPRAAGGRQGAIGSDPCFAPAV
jgi:hypothetical protein